jgi:hypothetical protein
MRSLQNGDWHTHDECVTGSDQIILAAALGDSTNPDWLSDLLFNCKVFIARTMQNGIVVVHSRVGLKVDSPARKHKTHSRQTTSIFNPFAYESCIQSTASSLGRPKSTAGRDTTHYGRASVSAGHFAGSDFRSEW